METHVRTLARTQAELGLSVHVLVTNHEGARTRHEHDGAVRVTRLGRLIQAAKLDLSPDLLGTLRGLDADVLHVHVPNPSAILAILLARPRAPLVVTYHSDHVRQPVRGALFRPIERRFYARVRALLATSPHYARGSSLLQELAARTTVVPLGIDRAPFAEPGADALAEAARLRARHPGPLWFACGRLVYYKGLPTAVRAMAQVPGTLLVAGVGPDRAALEELARTTGVADRVVFLGDVPDVAPYFLAATAFLFPSNARSEAFGLVQVEAMAAGCPVVNAEIPASGVPWVSPHEQTGLTVPPDDAPALARAARRLVDEAGLRERLAAAGRERARTEFDQRVMAERTVAVYRRVRARGLAGALA
jgi:rhamnosyl/mannosyltransferase